MIFLKTVTVVMAMSGLVNFNHSETALPPNSSMDNCRGYLTYLSTINRPDDVSRTAEWVSPDELKLIVDKGDYTVKLTKACVEIK